VIESLLRVAKCYETLDRNFQKNRRNGTGEKVEQSVPFSSLKKSNSLEDVIESLLRVTKYYETLNKNFYYENE